MHIQLNSDNQVLGSPELHARVERALSRQLKHLAGLVTRIEVHLNDENSLSAPGESHVLPLQRPVIDFVRHEHDFSDPAVEDVLDDMMELVMKQGGEVMVVPGEQMPTRTGLAAVYRY